MHTPTGHSLLAEARKVLCPAHTTDDIYAATITACVQTAPALTHHPYRDRSTISSPSIQSSQTKAPNQISTQPVRRGSTVTCTEVQLWPPNPTVPATVCCGLSSPAGACFQAMAVRQNCHYGENSFSFGSIHQKGTKWFHYLQALHSSLTGSSVTHLPFDLYYIRSDTKTKRYGLLHFCCKILGTVQIPK